MFGMSKKANNRFEMVSKDTKPKPSNNNTVFNTPSPNSPSSQNVAELNQTEVLTPAQNEVINPQNQLYQQTEEQLEFQQPFSDQQYAQVIIDEEKKAQQAYYAQIAANNQSQMNATTQNMQVVTTQQPTVQPSTTIDQQMQSMQASFYAEQEKALQQAMMAQEQYTEAQNMNPQTTPQTVESESQAAGSTVPVQTTNSVSQDSELSVSNNVASALVDKDKKVERPIKRFNYIIINNLGKKEKGAFDAESENDVRNFLINQDYQVLEVKERSKFDIDIGGNGKINSSDLSFSLTQLSTYLKSGITLADSVRILAKQTKKANLKRTFNQVVYQLLRGESFSDAMTMQGNSFPKLLINMVKTAEMTGDLPSILDDMAEYYASMEQTKKQMKSAMTYPAVVLTIALGVLVFMLTYLVPQFTSMFESQGAELPIITKIIIGVSDFIKTKWMLLIVGIVIVIGGFYLAFQKIQPFRKAIQILLMHMPVVGNVIIYNETANFSKTFASLLNHSVFITDSMEILSKITTNEVFKGIISKTLENLSKGDSISSAFRGEWAVPIVAYEMIVTGETTGQLGAMMEKVAEHFQMLHKNIIDQMKSLIEPIMICFLAVVVGIILVSIIQPMFSIYGQIK